ncbi:hypothetical protein REPUB_Repub05bG0097700 [Reevesia pubescens]
MRILIWNIRGLGNSAKWGILRSLINLHKIEMVLLQETKLELVDEKLIRNIWPDLNFDKHSNLLLVYLVAWL